MAIQTWFPTSIYIENLATSKNGLSRKWNAEILEQCYLVRETDLEGRKWSKENYVGGYTSYASLADLHTRFPHFEELGRALEPHARKFARALEMDLNGKKLNLTDMWLNVMPHRTSHSGHIHPHSVLSGTYYVSVPPGSSALKIEDPRLGLFMNAPIKRQDAKPKNQVFAKLEPKDGQLALWESWLRHEVPPNTAKKDRVSISFNFGI